ncbi:MAG: SMC-Scp complex subunit ScpB [Planctomycetota bacterium]
MIRDNPLNARKSEERTPPPRAGEVDQLLEAILFVGAQPVTVQTFCDAFPSLNTEIVVRGMLRLSARYRRQKRPYRIRKVQAGYVLELLPHYRADLQSKTRTERGVKLARPAIEVLSLVAYRQPIAKEDIEELLGIEAGVQIRQLLKRQLIARGDAGSKKDPATYVTTSRFLELFNLESLDELPSCEEIQ